MNDFSKRTSACWVLAALALVLAAIGARPYAGSWNDGSRLAAVESLLERGTLAIDGSFFCRTAAAPGGFFPYDPALHELLAAGTQDKLIIRGEYHSDKPPGVSMLMAGIYRLGMWLGFPAPHERPDLFIWWLTLLTSGLAYAAAVGCTFRLGQLLALSPCLNLAWTGSFALATFALAYTRHVNNHVIFLGVMAAALVQVVHLAKLGGGGAGLGKSSWGTGARLLWLGALAGLAFHLDFAAGPLLVVALSMWVLYRLRRLVWITAFMAGMTPLIAWALALNYQIGGVLKPLNMVPEFLAWPGSPFDTTNMTGRLRHGPWQQIVYALALLVGRHGLLTHNLPLLLALPAGWRLLRRSTAYRPEAMLAAGWCGAVWLLYAVLSNNYSGACCSIRWFVPLLAPLYLILALDLRDRPAQVRPFLILSAWGLALGMIMWHGGPWIMTMVPLLWPINGAAALSWGLCAWGQRRMKQDDDQRIGWQKAA